MVSRYTLISRFSRSTKNALLSGKHSCYSLFHFKFDLENAALKLWIKLWPETSFVYLLWPYSGYKYFGEGNIDIEQRQGFSFGRGEGERVLPIHQSENL